MKYDIEVSGFGSEALGHVCLINLKEQILPGANGSKDWPTWTLPVLRWTKAQGGVGGYAHSGSGLQLDPAAATGRLLEQFDADRNGRLDSTEAARGLLPEAFAGIDTDRDGALSEAELKASHDRADDQLPNYAIPELNSVGAQEIFVTAAHGARRLHQRDGHRSAPGMERVVPPAQRGVSAQGGWRDGLSVYERDRVGQGRTYVYLGSQDRVDYAQWAEGIRARPELCERRIRACARVHGRWEALRGRASLAAPRSVTVKASVAFSPETPLEPAYGGAIPTGGRRYVGDTIIKRETSRSIRSTSAGGGWSRSW
jgi:hypothetical protein